MRFAFCNEGFGERPWPQVCKTIAEAGYEGVEVAPFTFADSVEDISAAQRTEIRNVATLAGLEIIGLHWLLVKPEGLHISHPDRSVRARTAQYLGHLARFCADLGGTVMVFGSPAQRGPAPGTTAEQAWRWATETFREVIPVLEDRHVTLCIEPLAPADANWVNTAEEARRLIETLGHPSFRLTLDVKATSCEGTGVAEVIRANRDLIAHVHGNDANSQAPGFGEVDFRPILAALPEIGYDGYVSVEPFELPQDAAVIARQSLRYLRQCAPA